MTDRFAVALFERLFIPKPWAGTDLTNAGGRLEDGSQP